MENRALYLDPKDIDADKFWANVDKSASGGCWVWTAGKARGYGQFVCKSGKRAYAHRVSIALAGVVLIPGLEVDHLCRNPACVNLAHLEQVTPATNNLRGAGPTAKNKARTHCRRNHELAGDNLRLRHRDGRVERTCRACRALTAKQLRAAQSATNEARS